MRSTRTLLASSCMLLATLVVAQAPQGFSYQAVARDANGDALASHALDVQFQLHQGSALGAVVYAESHSTTTNDHGLFTLQVGGGAPGTGTFSGIDWRSGPYFLEVLMDVSSGGSFSSMGTQQLLSVPYALYAANSNLPNGTEVGQIAHWTGTTWAVDSGLYVSDKRFGIGVTTPEAPLSIQATDDGKLFSVTGQPTPVGEASDDKYRLAIANQNTDSSGLTIDQDTTGGSVSRLFIQKRTGNVGIGTQDPPAPLALVSRSVLKQYFQSGDKPTASQFGITLSDTTGFGIDQGTPDSLVSRLFIRSSNGHVGIGTQDPPGVLSIESRDILKTYFQNGDIPTADDFAFTTDTTGFGIDQGIPGSLTNRLFIRKDSGRVGIGTITPGERLEVNGAIKLGDTFSATPADGTVRWHASDFEGRKGGAWVSLTGGSSVPNGTEEGQIMHWTGTAWAADSGLYVHGKRFGIGIATPEAPLGIAADTTGGSAITIYQASSNTGPGPFNPLAWNIAVNPSNSDVAGFSIDDASSGTSMSRLFIADSTGNVGIGTTHPEAPLAIEPRDYLYQQFQNGDIPTGEDFMISSGGGTGLSIDQDTIGGSVSRMFFDAATGNVGVGTLQPTEKYYITSVQHGKRTGLGISNGAVSANDGWVLGHLDDAVTERSGAFVVLEKKDTTKTERITMLPERNVGINETMPNTTLHVSRALSDPQATTDLQEGTGIAIIGPITDHIVADYRGLQARHGEYVGGSSTLSLAAADLNLQPLGGRILVHEATHVLGRSAVITEEASLGLGTLDPTEKLHLQDSVPDGMVGVRILNTATVANQGFSMGHLHDASSVRDGAFSLFEESSAGTGPVERITVLPTQNVGINEPTPSTTLHVSRPASDPLSLVDLQENTGILTVGPIEQNIVFDAQGIQAKQLIAGTTSIQGASHLRLQPLGGDIQIHSEDALTSNQVTITSDGKIGVGKTAAEKVDINGAITIGNTSSAAPADGTIRFNGTDFEGRVAGDWAIFNGTRWEKVDNTDHIFYNAGTAPRVGIGTSTPDVTLHVSRPSSDPATPTSLDAGSGIACFGDLIDSNLNLDDDGIQARSSAPPGSPHVFTWNALHLQRLGGDILIHGDDAVASNQVSITSDGKIGVGKDAIEKVDINGAIRIGDTQSASAEDGTIRWTGTDFEGRKGGSWNSLTTHTNTDGLWQTEPTGEIHFSPPGGGAKVSLNLPAPKVTMRVDSWAAIVERSTGAVFQNTVTTSSTDPADNRVGVEIKNSGTWGGDPLSKNIGLYVSEVTGQTEASSNIAALINGNTVVGDLTGGQLVGTNGTNVLAIQNGTVPANGLSSGPGSVGGIQVYSADVSGVPTLHVMTGDGAVMKLYRQPDMTAADASAVGPVYDPTTAVLIENMRTRINELEAILKNVGLLAP